MIFEYWKKLGSKVKANKIMLPEKFSPKRKESYDLITLEDILHSDDLHLIFAPVLKEKYPDLYDSNRNQYIGKVSSGLRDDGRFQVTEEFVRDVLRMNPKGFTAVDNYFIYWNTEPNKKIILEDIKNYGYDRQIDPRKVEFLTSLEAYDRFGLFLLAEAANNGLTGINSAANDSDC
ncbi:hypothetical protein EHO58_13525 [Leptospira selangorensis]|uniref:hypothetical protein n=1 Tax=Leptospira selangorensis TaxID=2484982 RepID=UPI001083DDF2|nr:hypothetical protein [Leptospira selangorensis]TGK03438.1 hypothetical protein EHO58_13525 [Leptospira selangorensis]